MATWNPVAASTKWMNWKLFPSLDVHVIRSLPTQSLNSRGSESVAGRATFGFWNSWHVLHWKSSSPRKTTSSYPCIFSTSCNFLQLGWPRLWWILDIQWRVLTSNDMNFGPCWQIDRLTSWMKVDPLSPLSPLRSPHMDLSWLSWVDSTLDSLNLSSCPRSWDRKRFGSLSMVSGASRLVGVLSFCSGVSSSWRAKMVIRKRDGGVGWHSCRLLKTSQLHHGVHSRGDKSCRARPIEHRHGASPLASRIGGLRWRSVPLQSSTTRTTCSGQAFWMASNKGPLCNTNLPTLGATFWASWRRFFKFSATSGRFSVSCPDSGLDAAMEWSASGGTRYAEDGLLPLSLRRLASGRSAGKTSCSTARTKSGWATDFSCTCLLAFIERAKRCPKVAVYNSVYCDRAIRCDWTVILPATGAWAWSLVHKNELMYLAMMFDVVTTWVPFWIGKPFSGCVSLPAWHWSQRATSALSMRRAMISCNNMSDPTGCSRWKWYSEPVAHWCWNKATHSSRKTSSCSLAHMIFRAASVDRAALNWLHLHQARHFGEAQIFLGLNLRSLSYNLYLPSTVLRSPSARPNRWAVIPWRMHCLVNWLSLEQKTSNTSSREAWHFCALCFLK